MRRIPLSIVPIRLKGMPTEAADIEFSYGDNLIGIINASAAARGLPLTDINKSLRVIQPLGVAMANKQTHFDLEDADWEHLKRLVEGFSGWRIVHSIVPTFVKEITNAESLPTITAMKE
jgi:hypothetical protein